MLPEVVTGKAPPAAGSDNRRRRWWSGTLTALGRSRLATAGAIILGCFIVMAIVGPLVAPYNPSATSSVQLFHPYPGHLLGTTQSGQDVLSQLLDGAAPSLELGFLTALFATILSVIVGVASGYLSGAAGESLSSLANVFLVIPALPLIIVIAAYLPSRGVLTLAVVISVTGWAWGARLLRAQTMSLRRRDDIIAARAIGERPWRIMFVEMMPSLLPIIVSGFLFTSVFAIVTQAGLAFLGLTDISSWNWGTMLYWAQNNQAFTLGAWWWYVPPGLCVALVGMSLGLINFGIDELMNPRLRVARVSRRARQREQRREQQAAAAAAPAAHQSR
jgi:peptide/nickel transport system permease protein